jgi:7,8-dihydro-6-hydroxymethylpterin-pyrophosphokinase
MQEIEEVNIIDDRAKIVSLLTALQKQKLTLGQSFELERLLTKERNRAIQNRVTDLDIILGYYLIGLNGYVEGCYYPKE